MKSTINTLADYREAPFQWEQVIRCPEEHIQKQLRRLTRAGKRTEPVQTVEQGDVVVLALESALPKFNRPMVPLTVGGGLFDTELEEQLAGHAVGETFSAQVQGQAVTVTIKQGSRTIFPAPTDEMAAAYAAEHEELAGIDTVEKYRRHVAETYCAEQREPLLYDAMDSVLEYVLTHSDWNFDDGELAESAAELKTQLRSSLSEEEHKEFDHLTEEELRSYYDVGSYEELERLLVSESERRIATALLGAACTGADPAEETLDELEELCWRFFEQYVKEHLNIKEEV